MHKNERTFYVHLNDSSHLFHSKHKKPNISPFVFKSTIYFSRLGVTFSLERFMEVFYFILKQFFNGVL